MHYRLTIETFDETEVVDYTGIRKQAAMIYRQEFPALNVNGVVIVANTNEETRP